MSTVEDDVVVVKGSRETVSWLVDAVIQATSVGSSRHSGKTYTLNSIIKLLYIMVCY